MSPVQDAVGLRVRLSRRFRPQLRTVFIAVNVVILLIPLGGVFILRLYESALIRRAERELIAQGAVITAAFREEVARELAVNDLPRREFGASWSPTPPSDDAYQPISAVLNLAVDPVWPRPIDARRTTTPADPITARAGERLSAVLREAQRITLVGVRVVDPNGTVVASSRGELGLSLRHRMEVRQALRGEHVSMLRERAEPDPSPPIDSLSRTNRLRVFVAFPVTDGERLWGAVLLSRTPMSVGQSLYGIRWHLAAGAGAVLLTVFSISAFISRTITRPVHQLILQTQRVASGDQTAAVPLDQPGTYEVAQLSTAVASMARALDQRAQYIAAFAANVSHEFKTPLTAIRGTVELLRDHITTMSADERDRFLNNLDLDAERLQRLVGRLLELARADVVKPSGDTCNVAEVLQEIAARHQGASGALRIEHAPDGVAVSMSSDTLSSILNNLLDNARRHGGASQITVRAQLDDTGKRVELSVTDNGPGISAGNLARIFDPFFTTARETGGTGLGLSIVRSLVESHDGQIEVFSQPGETRFRIELPANR